MSTLITVSISMSRSTTLMIQGRYKWCVAKWFIIILTSRKNWLLPTKLSTWIMNRYMQIWFHCTRNLEQFCQETILFTSTGQFSMCQCQWIRGISNLDSSPPRSLSTNTPGQLTCQGCIRRGSINHYINTLITLISYIKW